MLTQSKVSRLCFVSLFITFLWWYIFSGNNENYSTIRINHNRINQSQIHLIQKENKNLLIQQKTKVLNYLSGEEFTLRFNSNTTPTNYQTPSTTKTKVHNGSSTTILWDGDHKQMDIESWNGFQKLSWHHGHYNSSSKENVVLPTKYISDTSQDKELMKFMQERKIIIDKRRTQVKEVCKKHSKLLKKYTLNNNLVWDLKHHIGYCRNAKVGTTSWLKQYLIWSGKEELLTKNMTVEYIHQMADEVFPRISHVETINEIIVKKAIIFTVVRHPFTRLVSAYRDKITNGYKTDIYNKITQHSLKYTSNSHKTQNNDTNSISNPTFHDFFSYVTDTIINCRANLVNSACLEDIDVHWMPYFVRCSPCNYNYNIISKMETFDADMKYIKTIINNQMNKKKLDIKLNETITFSHNNKSSNYSNSKNQLKIHSNKGQSTLQLANEYYKYLTNNEKQKLFKAYYFDFILFGYDLNKLE